MCYFSAIFGARPHDGEGASCDEQGGARHRLAPGGPRCPARPRTRPAQCVNAEWRCCEGRSGRDMHEGSVRLTDTWYPIMYSCRAVHTPFILATIHRHQTLELPYAPSNVLTDVCYICYSCRAAHAPLATYWQPLDELIGRFYDGCGAKLVSRWMSRYSRTVGTFFDVLFVVFFQSGT